MHKPGMRMLHDHKPEAANKVVNICVWPICAARGC